MLGFIPILALCVSLSGHGAHALDCVDTLANTPKASTLVQLVTRAGLDQALKQGTVTIFAPTNDAFDKVSQDTLQVLLTDNAALTDVLSYHVISGRVASSDLSNDIKATALNSKKLRFNIYTEQSTVTVTANGVKVSEADVVCDNGVIHFVDSVLSPPNKTVVQIIAEDPELSTLLQVVTDAGIAFEFQADPMTVLAPTNDAFMAADQTLIGKLLEPSNKAYLKSTLEYHGINATEYKVGLESMGDFYEVGTIYNNADNKIFIERDAIQGLAIQGKGAPRNPLYANVTVADIVATNGVIHKIDRVLVPLPILYDLIYSSKPNQNFVG